ncbi:hypothetical protein [Francisella halioticida]|nr:hypothetical protein [Francisella halioticida]
MTVTIWIFPLSISWKFVLQLILFFQYFLEIINSAIERVVGFDKN